MVVNPVAYGKYRKENVNLPPKLLRLSAVPCLVKGGLLL